MTVHILVIKHGALGDIVLATGPFAAIRQHHADAHITLLTTKLYAELLKQSPYFDEIWIDTRPKFWQLHKLFPLIKKLRSAHFTRVYDLQTSRRSSFYLSFFKGQKVEWSGIAAGASHRHNTPHRTRSHTIDRQKEQLAIAGINVVPPPNISWLAADISHFNLPEHYALIVPGGSAHRLEKRWPPEHYISLCQWLVRQEIIPLLIGTVSERSLLDTIKEEVPEAMNLCNHTSFAEIASLSRKAVFAVGNDTGPMHLIAAAHCPSLVLFSHASDPDLCAPRDEKVHILREANLSYLKPEMVENTLKYSLFRFRERVKEGLFYTPPPVGNP